jgi:hypothetical protein
MQDFKDYAVHNSLIGAKLSTWHLLHIRSSGDSKAAEGIKSYAGQNRCCPTARKTHQGCRISQTIQKQLMLLLTVSASNAQRPLKLHLLLLLLQHITHYRW